MYTEEKAKALNFINECENLEPLKEVLTQITNPDYSHSDRWSAVFDVVFDNYSYLTSSERGAIITGLVYLVEDKEEILI